MKKFVCFTNYEYDPSLSEEVITPDSMTVQDADLKIAQIVQRYTRKLPYPIDPNAYYEDNPEIYAVYKMDAFEKMEYIKQYLSNAVSDAGAPTPAATPEPENNNE